MKRTIYRSQKARQDPVDAFRFIAREAGFRVAQRFFAQAEATFTVTWHVAKLRAAGFARADVSDGCARHATSLFPGRNGAVPLPYDRARREAGASP